MLTLGLMGMNLYQNRFFYWLFRSMALALVCLSLTGIAGAGAIGAEKAAKLHNKASRIVINIPSRTLWVYQNDRIVRYFPVGVGRRSFPSPLGKYKVIRKVINPGWENPYRGAGQVRIRPGARNPLGTRWIGFKQYKGGEYGIHGTDNPRSVGKFSSHGCIRMKVKDAEALFDMVELGTPVEVVYDLVLIRPANNEMRLVVFPDAFGKGMPTVEEVVRRVEQAYPTAQVDVAKVAHALKKPLQKPVSVGLLAPEPEPDPVAETNENEVETGLKQPLLPADEPDRTPPLPTPNPLGNIYPPM